MVEPLWRDEAFSYLLSKKSLTEIVVNTAADFNPPLYYFTLHYWMKIFGISEISLRSLSLIFFFAAIFVVYLFLKEIIVNKSHLWIYLLLFCLNPFLLYYAFEARMYSMIVFFSMSSFYLFYKRKYPAMVVLNVLGLYTHYFFIFVILTQLFFNWMVLKQRSFKKIAFLSMPLLIFLPWFLYILPSFTAKAGNFWIQKMTFSDVLTSLTYLFFGYDSDYYNFYNRYSFIASLFLLLILLSVKKSAKNTTWLLLLCWAFLFYIPMVLASTIKPLFTARYMIYASTGLMLLTLYTIDTFKKTARLIVCLLLCVIIVHFWILQLNNRIRGGEVKTIRAIKTQASSGDLLYVTDPLHYFTALYYFGENRVYIYNSNSKQFPHYVGGALVIDEAYTREIPYFPQKAFIMQNGENYIVKTQL